MKRENYTIFDRCRIPDYDIPGDMKSGGNLIFDPNKCKECGICVMVCPAGGIKTDRANKMDLLAGRIKGGRYGLPRVDRVTRGGTLCVACFDCGAACPHGAISIESNFNPKYFYKRITQTGDLTYPKHY